MFKYSQAAFGGIALLILTSCAKAQEAPRAVQWSQDLNQAWETAKQQQKPVLLYATMDPCHFCRLMERNTFSNPTIAEKMNQGFVPLKLWATPQTRAVMAKLNIEGYPTILIVSPTKGVVDRLVGYSPPERFYNRLAKAAPDTPVAKQDSEF